MINTSDIVAFCDEVTQKNNIPDFQGSVNGLQLENHGEVTKIGAAVDAGLVPFQKAVERNIDFIVVHHGLFWNPPIPIRGVDFKKINLCISNNLAVYSSHLPLDCHPEIGNNVILAKKLGLSVERGFLQFEKNNIGLIARNQLSRVELKEKLDTLFPKGCKSLEFGTEKPKMIGILTGSGQSAVEKLQDEGVDTLITGELKQNHFNYAQENNLNIYLCGHYATETFGVKALAKKISEEFNIPHEFIQTECPI